MKKCYLCNQTENLEWHHILPKSLGGTDDPSNLLLLCSVHHGAIHGIKRRANMSDLTKEGIKKARERGLIMGFASSNYSKETHRIACKNSSAVRIENADTFAENLRELVEFYREAGRSINQIAGEFNKQGIKTARGGRWYAATVANLIRRLDGNGELKRVPRCDKGMKREQNQQHDQLPTPPTSKPENTNSIILHISSWLQKLKPRNKTRIFSNKIKK